MKALEPASLARWSLVGVWLMTAAVSVVEMDGQSRALLQAGGVTDRSVQHSLTWAGACVDVALGLALAVRPSPWIYRLCMLSVLGFSVLATVLTPDQWWHPFGPLLKNLPILAMLNWLRTQTHEAQP